MKRVLLLTVVASLVATAFLAAAQTRPSEPRSHEGGDSAEASPRGQWEYLVVQGGNVNFEPSGSGSMRKAAGVFSRESFPLEQNLDKLGKQGWELIQVTGNSADPTFVFKRQK